MSTFHIQESEGAEDTEINEDLQRVIEDHGTFYHKSSIHPLTEFQKHVNEAAIDMCIKKKTLMRELKCGDLLEMARKLLRMALFSRKESHDQRCMERKQHHHREL